MKKLFWACIFILSLSTPALADTHTAIATGPASAAGTWDKGAAPADGDAILINAAYTVTWDIDTSGWATGLAASTISGGELVFPTNASSYLKLAGNLTVTTPGQITCASSGSPLSPSHICTIDLNGSRQITGTGAIKLYSALPTNYYAKTTGAEAAGQTEINLDRDLSSDPLWAAGAYVAIANSAPSGGAYDTEGIKIIAAGGVGSDHIDITAGLTNQKATGSYVILLSRNIRIINGTATTGSLYSASSADNWFQCAVRHAADGHVVNVCSGTFYGTTIYATVALTGSNTFFRSNNSALDHCVIAGPAAGYCSYSSGRYPYSNSIFANCGTLIYPYAGYQGRRIYGCKMINANNGFFQANSNYVDSCDFIGVAYPFGSNSGYNVAYNCTTSGSTYDMYSAEENRFYNCLLGGTTENYGYNIKTGSNQRSFTVSYHHDQVAGAIKAWTIGGVTTSQAVTAPPGHTWAYQLVPESATYYGFFEEKYTLAARETLRVRCYFRKDTHGMTSTPKIELVKPQADPLNYSGYTALDSAAMSDTENAWETKYVSYTNPNNYELDVIVRVSARNATGNVYFLPERIRTPSLLNKGNFLN